MADSFSRESPQAIYIDYKNTVSSLGILPCPLNRLVMLAKSRLKMAGGKREKKPKHRQKFV